MCIVSNSVNEAQDLMAVTKYDDLPNSLIPSEHQYILPFSDPVKGTSSILSHLVFGDCTDCPAVFRLFLLPRLVSGWHPNYCVVTKQMLVSVSSSLRWCPNNQPVMEPLCRRGPGQRYALPSHTGQRWRQMEREYQCLHLNGWTLIWPLTQIRNI